MTGPAATPGTAQEGRAADRWRSLLEARAIPREILETAPRSPWRHDPARFIPPAEPEDTFSRRAALGLLGPDGGTVIDVGCGAGAAGLALVPAVHELVGVDHAEDMLEAFARACAERGVKHRAVLGPWPDVAEQAGTADVVVSHHVGYNTADLVPFIAAMIRAARVGVVLELHAKHPMAWMDPLWERFHGLRRAEPATADDLLAVLTEMGLRYEARRWNRPRRPRGPGEEVKFALSKLCLPDERRGEVEEALRDLPPRNRDLVTVTITSPAPEPPYPG